MRLQIGLGAVGVALLLGLSPATANTAQCPDAANIGSFSDPVRVSTVTTTGGGTSCLMTSDANSIPTTLAGYTFLDKFGEAGGAADGALSIVESSAGSGHGTFSIVQALVAGFSNLVLALKDGNNASPAIGYFALDLGGVFSGQWTLEEWVGGEFDKYKGFSSAVLFGQPSPVPLPASLPLFLGGLAGLGLLKLRRRKAIAV